MMTTGRDGYAPKRRVAVVSPSDQMKNPMQCREVKLGDLSKLHPDIDWVRMTSHGGVQPAVIGMRSVLHSSVELPQGQTDTWLLTLSPQNDRLSRRLLARASGTMMDPSSGDVDVREEKRVRVRYDALAAMDRAHQALSDLSPPHKGTTIQVAFAITRTLERFVDIKVSSIAGLEREAAKARAHNALVIRNSVTVPFFGWILRQRGEFVEVPPVPDDSWRHFKREQIGDVVRAHFLPVLESLWKASFAEGLPADLLREQGFPLDKLEKTMLGDAGFNTVVQSRKGLAGLTLLDTGDHKP